MSAPIDISLVVAGPCQVIYKEAGGATYQIESVGDVTFDPGLSSADQETASFGPIPFKTGTKPTLSFTPLGETRLLPMVNAFAALVPGRSLTGKKVGNAWVDNEVIVQPNDADQDQYTFHGVAISTAPDPTLSATENLFGGNLVFTVKGKNATAITDPDKFYTKADNAGLASAYDPADLIRAAPEVNFSVLLADTAGAPNFFATAEGAKLALGLATEEKTANGEIWDVRFKNVAPVITLRPIGISQDALMSALKIQGAGAEIGRKLADSGAKLLVRGGGVFMQLPLAGIRKAAVVYGAAADRLGDIEFVGSVAPGAGGVIPPRYYVGTVEPV